MADSQVPQFYSDHFSMALGPFGCALTFGLTSPAALAGEAPQVTPVATVRMSLEHLKVIAFLIQVQVSRYQAEFGSRIELPDKAIESLGATRDKWATFWGEK